MDNYYIYKLLKPIEYREKEIQEAVEHYWSWIFPGYELIYSKTDYMPQNWQPDLFAKSRGGDSLLLGEMKVAGTHKAPFRQVADYAERLIKKYPYAEVRLFVMGPWNLKNNDKERWVSVYWDTKYDDEEEDRDYEALYIPFQRIGIDLMGYAEKYFDHYLEFIKECRNVRAPDWISPTDLFDPNKLKTNKIDN